MANMTYLLKIGNTDITPYLKKYEMYMEEMWDDAGRNMKGDLIANYVGATRSIMPSFWERLLRRFRRRRAAALILFACIQAAVVSAQINLGGHVSLSKKLSVIKTEYFDFIFAEESAASARHLALCADDLYRKAAGMLHIHEHRRYLI